jgi:LPS sulfotransferase NodH
MHAPVGPEADASGALAARLGAVAAVDRSYVIATAPRTGSSLLAEALAATQRAGNPDEFFDPSPANEAHWQWQFGAPDGPGYVDRLVEATRTPNGVFGFKLHWHQIPALRRRLIQAMPAAEAPDDRPVADLLRRRFDSIRFIRLSRRNKLAQAISYYRAVDTQVWRVWTDGRAAGAGPNKNVAYDRAAIQHYLRIVTRMDAEWRQFLAQHRITPLVVVYEDFIRSYGKTIASVLEFLDLPSDGLVLPPPRLQRLADPESAEWERRFRAESRPASLRLAVPQAVVQAPDPAKELIAYDVATPTSTLLAPARPSRAWMDATPRRFAYRCLPMVIANQWGWLIRLTQRVEVIWDGSDRADGLRILDPPDGAAIAASHFGCGVLTFHAGYLFRTTQGYNLHVRGPANWPKDGISPLEGIIESDWIEATFTMNWKVTRPNHPIVFQADEPIAMVSPVRRGELEQFTAEIRPLSENPQLLAGYNAWSASRNAFNTGLRLAGSAARKEGWQKHYVRGRTIRDEPAQSHQTAIGLTDFVDRR